MDATLSVKECWNASATTPTSGNSSANASFGKNLASKTTAALSYAQAVNPAALLGEASFSALDPLCSYPEAKCNGPALHPYKDELKNKTDQQPEKRDKLDSINRESSNIPHKESNQNKHLLSGSSYCDPSTTKTTPNGYGHAKTPKIFNIKKGQVKGTTFLSESESNLELSFISEDDKTSHESCLIDSFENYVQDENKENVHDLEKRENLVYNKIFQLHQPPASHKNVKSPCRIQTKIVLANVSTISKGVSIKDEEEDKRQFKAEFQDGSVAKMIAANDDDEPEIIRDEITPSSSNSDAVYPFTGLLYKVKKNLTFGNLDNDDNVNDCTPPLDDSNVRFVDHLILTEKRLTYKVEDILDELTGLPRLQLLKNHFADGGMLSADAAEYIFNESCKIIETEPHVVKIDKPVTVCSKVPRKFIDVVNFFDITGSSSQTKYLFLPGNDEEHEFASIEILLYLWSIKIKHPSRFYILQEKHEYSDRTQFKLKKYCCEKYGKESGEKVFEAYKKSYLSLPLAAKIDQRFLVEKRGSVSMICALDPERLAVQLNLDDSEYYDTAEDSAIEQLTRMDVGDVFDAGLLQFHRVKDCLEEGVFLSDRAALQIITVGGKIIQHEPIDVKIDLPVVVCADVPVQFSDFAELFKIGGDPSERKYLVFLGDCVERGCLSLQILIYLWSLKINFKNKFYLLKGNYNCQHPTPVITLEEKCHDMYGDKGDELYHALKQTFTWLPVMVEIDKQCFCMHGDSTISFIETVHIDRLEQPENREIVSGSDSLAGASNNLKASDNKAKKQTMSPKLPLKECSVVLERCDKFIAIKKKTVPRKPLLRECRVLLERCDAAASANRQTVAAKSKHLSPRVVVWSRAESPRLKRVS